VTDWRDLLKRYMKHVLDEEGTTLIGSLKYSNFTEEERDMLIAVDGEIDQDKSAAHDTAQSLPCGE
jgi:hypothetical protein